jgi:CTP-dependent riboflavin kinase
MADDNVMERLQELSGFSLVPGTLNVRLIRALERDSRWRYVPAVDISPDWEARSGQAGYFITLVMISGRYRGLAFQADERGEPGYPSDQVELLSEVHLRTALGLRDGDRISVRIQSLS